MTAYEYLSQSSSTPVCYTFLWQGIMHEWAPDSQCVMVRKIRDPELARACHDYLVSVGANFDSMGPLREWAARHSWIEGEDLPDLTQDDD